MNTTDQTQSQDLTPEEAKASMGLATHLMDKLMPQAPEASQDQESAPQEEQAQKPEDNISPRIDELESKFSDLEKTVQETIKSEMGGLKDMIQQALTEDNEQNQ